MTRTVEQIQIELDAVNEAILGRIKGTRFQITKFTGHFSSYFEDKTTLDELRAIRTTLYRELEQATNPTATPTYRTATTQIIGRK